MFGKKKKTTSGESKYWRCPNCGAVLEKKEEAAARIKILEKLEQLGATVEDLGRCSNCGTTVNTKDIYSGKYDC